MIDYEKYLTDCCVAELIDSAISNEGTDELNAVIARFEQVAGVTAQMWSDLENALNYRIGVIESSAFAFGWACAKQPEKLIFKNWQGEP